MAFRAVGDAYILKNENCWPVAVLQESEDASWSAWDCAPGRHEPNVYVDYDTEFDGRGLGEVVGGSARSCEYYDESLIEEGDIPFELSESAVAHLNSLPSSGYWLCEESSF